MVKQNAPRLKWPVLTFGNCVNWKNNWNYMLIFQQMPFIPLQSVQDTDENESRTLIWHLKWQKFCPKNCQSKQLETKKKKEATF